jgi:hypothetical protein
MMGRAAYLIIWINTETLKVESVGIYSEADPESNLKHWPVEIAKMTADSYENALKKMLEYLLDLHPIMNWVESVPGYRDTIDRLKVDVL